MREFVTDKIRNIALLGHMGSGKTSMTESLLFVSGKIPKKGEVERQTTKSDYLLEEHLRGSSMQTSLIPISWQDYKLNFLDVPGNDERLVEFNYALDVVKGAIIFIDATKGVEVGTERAWHAIRERNIPAVLFINKMDKENINYERLLEEIREKLGKKAVPFTYPIGREQDFEGFVNVVEMKARIYNGVECVDAEIWEEKLPKVNALHGMILESVAETSEVLLEKYLSGEEITDDEIKKGLRKGVLNGELTPIVVGSVLKNIGVQTTLNMLIDFLPAPDELKELEAKTLKGEIKSVKTDSKLPFSGFVFKTTVDPFAGNMNLVKINSGTLVNGQEIYNPKTENISKIVNLSTALGKELIPIEKAYAGDMVLLTKIDGLTTGDSISDPKNILIYEDVTLPTPTIYQAISPLKKADEDKLSQSLQRLQLEDPSFEVKRVKETNQLLIGGYGTNHLQFIIDRLKSTFKVEVEVSEPKILYKETIKKKAIGEGKHKKQSGGAGQFGHVFIEFSPTEENFVFEEKVVGGAVPKGYFPAVEKGIIETFEKGPLAGFPIVNVKATLLDGSYHSVDSNEISFKLAAGLAFRNIVESLSPTLLEPILKLKIRVKEQFVGDIMGDLNKRRGRILGFEQLGNIQEITAEVPEAEVINYATDLKSMTQASGSFEREFVRYEEVPAHIIPKIIEQYKSK